jgi:succinate dehydrogenase/fumarate reductase flavoprotein subunit
MSPGNDPARALGRRPTDSGWIVLDARAAERFSGPPNHVSTAPGIAYAYLGDYRNSRRDLYHRADSLEDLAVQLGLDPARLAATVAATNAEREAQMRCETGSFVALGPVRSWIVLTEGGLAVDTACRVLDKEGTPVPGLFAAGSNGQGGLMLDGHGNHIGWAFISGRIAGRTAATAVDHETTETR